MGVCGWSGHRQAFRPTSDIATPALTEDAVALMGLSAALVGIVTTGLTDNPAWDAAAVVIGSPPMAFAVALAIEDERLILGGSLAADLKRKLPTAVEAHEGDAPKTVEVHVCDDGPGIQSMEIDALEDRREITELAHGSGLGLWVMKWFVDTVDGELRIDTREPRGTEVTFVLPTAPPPSPR